MNACSTLRTSVLFLAGLMLAATAVSKEIMVVDGDGTLQAAINDAGTVDGDTLLLASGTYSNQNGFDVTKSLTIRPVSASTSAVLVDTLDLDAANIVIQGLQFSNVNITGTSIAAVTWTILENTFVDGFPTFAGAVDDALYIVGNDIQITSGFFAVGWRADKLVYAAANSIVATSGSYAVDIRNADEAYLVGNDFDGPVPSNGDLVVDFILTTRSYMIGNRFDVGLTQNYGSGGSDRLMARIGGTPIVRNNLFRLTDISGLSSSLVAGVPMITVGTNSDFGRIENNVFDFNGLNLNATATASSGVIHTDSVVTIQSNIIVNTDRPIFTEAASTVAFNTFRNNLCFNTTAEMCPAGDGNLNVSPDFVDTTNYQLNTGSPAIDAGPDLAVLTDLDGSRVDLGLYGGGFPIDQYDAQRTDATSAPWVFPVFDATGDVGVLGDLPIRVIGIARIR